MSIADIFKIQQSYNLHNKFNDQTDWQEAFKIANNFAETSEKHRANRENLDTSAYRVDAINALNQAKTEEQALAFNIAQAKNQIADFYKTYGFDSQNNRYLNPEELRSLLKQYPSALNSQATLMLDEQTRNYLMGMAKNLAPINPMMASTYLSTATGSPFIVDNKGNLMNSQTGAVVGNIPDPTLLAYFAAGDAFGGFSGMLKAQQEVEKAKAIQEARNNSALEQIGLRSETAINKQNNWIDYRTAEEDWKRVSEELGLKADIADNQDDFKKIVAAYVNNYPHLKDRIAALVGSRIATMPSTPQP